MTRPSLLCVDDEPQLLEGLQLNLRKRFEVVTAPSGAAGLELLAGGLTPAVIVSDMRMPGMDGATFLFRARTASPDAVRVLLTGQTDLTAAIAAVNDGGIFRFLVKPCPFPTLVTALDAAVAQHDLITAERVLLTQTLHGCVKMLTEVLALTDPIAFGRATRIKRRVTELTGQLGLVDRWELEVAAMLSQLGAITLPAETAEKLYFAKPLSPDEHKMVARLPAVTEQLLSNIPRLDGVRAILATYPRAGGLDPDRGRVEEAAAILRAAIDFDALEAQGSTIEVALEALRSRGDRYAPPVLAALEALLGASRQVAIKELPLASLQAGMLLAEDLKRVDGMLLLARGVEITLSLIEHIRNFRPGTIREPVRVVVRVDGGLATGAPVKLAR